MIRTILCVLLLAPAAANAADVPPLAFQAAIEATLAGDPSLPAVLAAVSAPRRGIAWSGVATRPDLPPLRPATRFRIASVTKVFTAAATLRLVEDGKLRLTTPIAGLISPETTGALVRGGYDPAAINVQQLLSHTSGLFDYAMSPAYGAALMADPRRRWSRSEQIDFAMRHGKPLGPPGAQFGYSDTGYNILGEIIERSTARTLPAAIAQLLDFEGQGMRDTAFDSLSAAGRELAPQFLGPTETTGFDPSVDLFGGGGLVSTVGDLDRFIRPLLQGKLFHRLETLAAGLVTPVARITEGETPHANLLGHHRIGDRLCWSHGGFWGTLVIYCPDGDVAITIAVNQAMPADPAVVRRLAHDLLALADPRDAS